MAGSYNKDKYDVGENEPLRTPQQPYVKQPQGYGLEPQRGYSPSNTEYVERHYLLSYPSARPPDYMILSAISCCFCWPLALGALCASCSSRNASSSYDYEKAQQHGELAKNLAVSAIVTGIIAFFLFLIIRLLQHNAALIQEYQHAA